MSSKPLFKTAILNGNLHDFKKTYALNPHFFSLHPTLKQEIVLLCIQHRQFAIFLYLVEKEQMVFSTDCEELQQSATCGFHDFIQYLLDHGADIHSFSDSPLRFSTLYEHIDCVKLLLQRGADVQAMNNEALRMAAEQGSCEIVELLIQYGAPVDKLNNKALIISASEGHLPIIKILLHHGAAIEEQTIQAALKSKHTELAKWLKGVRLVQKDQRAIQDILDDKLPGLQTMAPSRKRL